MDFPLHDFVMIQYFLTALVTEEWKSFGQRSQQNS